MRAAWYVRSRQMLDKIFYWLAITGYNSNDRSLDNRLYLIYIFLFFGFWGLAMLGLVTSVVVKVLLLVAPSQTSLMGAQIMFVALIAWWLWKLFEAARRSPVRFSPEDASLVCATPVSRRAVAFVWLIGDWFTNGAPFWAIAITLGFTFTEIAVGPNQFWPNVGSYLAAGLRFFLPVLILHLGLLMVAWALGCYRLRGGREPQRFYLVPIAIAFVCAAGFWFSLSGAPGLQLLIYPLLMPVLAGSSLAGYALGLVTAAAWVGVGAVGLYTSSQKLNLSRAAQETETKAMINAARTTGDAQLARNIRLKQRLQFSPPTRIPALPGEAILVWRQVVRATRDFDTVVVFDWAVLFALNLGFLVATNWLSRGVIFLIWVVRYHVRASADVRSDLEMWYLFAPLPFRLERRLLAELLPAVLIATLLGWLAWTAGSIAGLGSASVSEFVLLPLIALNVACSATFDTFRQTGPKHLSSGNVPEPGVVAVIISALILGVNYLILTSFGADWIGVIPGIMGNGLVFFAMLGICKDRYQNLGK